MSGKKIILERIKQNKPTIRSFPETFSGKPDKTDEDLLEAFKSNLLHAGAGVVELNNKDELKYYIGEKFSGAIDFQANENWQKYGTDYPKNELEKIGTAILCGKFGVVENGAIWLDEECFPNRLIPFIAEKLILKLRKEDLVSNMLEAYQRIDLKTSGFGVLISGPSKTADIEQSLVYGAHGAKELAIILY